MRAAGRFAVHLLAHEQRDFVRRAAPSGADRFAEPGVLRRALAVIHCDLDTEHQAGDHSIVVGRVRALEVAEDREPLVYFAGSFGAFNPVGETTP
jgi:flavin reductase (DIM6/NTAB) family NADH-FMN oxidoreductase RutF